MFHVDFPVSTGILEVDVPASVTPDEPAAWYPVSNILIGDYPPPSK